MERPFDAVVVGGGIVGLAAAFNLLKQRPGIRLAVLEKEPGLASHQTGHNSGVIHSGVYYRPGSLKAKLSVQGHQTLKAFCRDRGIPYKECGKLITAVSSEEVPRLETLYRWGIENRVPGLMLLDSTCLKEREPHAAGIQALYVPGTAIVNFMQVAGAIADEIRRGGGEIRTESRLLRIVTKPEHLVLETASGEIPAKFLVNCAGLHADRLARQTIRNPSLQIIPFRGEYWEISPYRKHLVQGLIYPVPDPRFPFLGVHLSRTIDGRVEVGPNAVLALHREGYRRGDFDLRDTLELLRFPGFWRMSARYWRTGIEEVYRSFRKEAFVRSVQRLVPEIQAEDLIPSDAGVRAQAVNLQGELQNDFYLGQSDRCLHVCNAPSPAATASLAIGDYIARTVSNALQT